MNCPEEPAGEGTFPESCDAFYRGAFYLLQPQGRGYRSGLDALILAAAVDPSASGRALDMGSGAGAVALAAAVRAPALRLVLAEKEPVMAELARRTLALPQNRRFQGRLAVAEVDVLADSGTRRAAGLAEESFDLVLTNPPFHPPGHRRPPDALRQAALSGEGDGIPERWTETACRLLRPKGQLILIARPDGLPGLLASLQRRCGDVAVLPVHTNDRASASRILIAARRGSKAPLRLLKGLDLTGSDGLSASIAEGREFLRQLFT